MKTPARFRPPWWLRSPHVQTLWPFLFRRRATTALAREQLELPDGDFLDLRCSRKRRGKIVLVIHGLEGSIRSHYAGALLNKLEQAGYRPVFMHFRGCGGRSNRLPRAYHSGDTADIAAVVAYIAERWGEPVFAAIGFSLGANALLKWLGETGAACPLQKAVAVSVPFRLQDAASRLNRGFSVCYRHYLLGSLKASYRKKFRKRESPLSVDLKTIKTLWQYDEAITAPLHGFEGADDYYRRSSCRPFLKHVRIPACIIHALDDPFMSPQTAPTAAELAPSIQLHLTAHGGHVGFVDWRFPLRFEYWHENVIEQFLAGDDGF